MRSLITLAPPYLSPILRSLQLHHSLVWSMCLPSWCTLEHKCEWLLSQVCHCILLCHNTHLGSAASFIPMILRTQQLPKPHHPCHFCQTLSYEYMGSSLGPAGWCYGSVLSSWAAHPFILGSTPLEAHCSQNCNAEGSRSWLGVWTTCSWPIGEMSPLHQDSQGFL